MSDNSNIPCSSQEKNNKRKGDEAEDQPIEKSSKVFAASFPSTLEHLDEAAETEDYLGNGKQNLLEHEMVYIMPGDPERETYRLSTFMKFPPTIPVNVCLLAAHGFLYTGYKDRVKCFSCGSRMQDWAVGNNPKSATLHTNGCKLVLGIEGLNQPIDVHRPLCFEDFNPPVRDYPDGFVDTSASHLNDTDSFNNGLNSSMHSPSATTERRSSSHNVPENSAFSLPASESPPIEFDLAVSVHPRRDADSHTPDLDDQSVWMEQYPCLYPVNPHMKSEQARLETFDSGSPARYEPGMKIDLAKAGFYFLGEEDRTKCWYCNGGIQNWDSIDEPWIEHAKRFPRCSYLLSRKGDRFIEEIMEKCPNFQTSETNRLRGEAKIRRIMKAAKCETENVGSTSSSDIMYDGENDGGFRRKIFSYSECFAPSQDMKNQAHTLRELINMKRCRVCSDCNINMLVLPCRHFACKNCSKDAKECPICKAEVKNSVKVLRARKIKRIQQLVIV